MRGSTRRAHWLALFSLGFGLLAATGCSDDVVTPPASTVELRYDGNNANSPNLAAATYEAAARFTTAQTGSVAGGRLQRIDFYLFATPDQVEVKVYGPGTATTPGAVLYSAVVTSAVVAGAWNSHTLQNPVFVPNGDLWLSVRFTHSTFRRVIGCDSGPANANGDWLFASTDSAWSRFNQRFPSESVNWNIRGQVEVSPELRLSKNEPAGIGSVLAGRIPQLDALRALAILAVILHNAGARGLEQPAGRIVKLVQFAATSGWVGVQLFFVLSGFLITGILVDGIGRPRHLRNFYMRRVLRIFPLYYAFLFILFVVMPLAGLRPQWLAESSESQFWYWSYLINWAEPFLGSVKLPHLWSLGVEEQFYILWPLLVVTVRPRTLVRCCLGLIVSAIVIRGLLAHAGSGASEQAAYTLLISRWDSLALGALLALAVRDAAWYARLRAWMPRIALLLLGAVLLEIVRVREFAPVQGTLGFLNQTTSALLFAALIFASFVPGGTAVQTLQRALMNPALRLIGKYSYAIYVVHIPMKYLWFSTLGLLPVQPQAWQQLGVMAYNFSGVSVLCTGVACLSWHLLEQPFLGLKRHFS